ncbi:MAG: hypothetical protein CVV02_05665 [Firmicutes bacterium HGW-Firmicutes-7]|nr:MAG: hypothetical protein CVV02_05665 [Firmicutes bacterium HGW-Firmicutes-7]
MGGRLVRRNRQLVHNEPKMDFSSRNARLLSTFGLMGILTFLISTMFKYIEGSSRILNIETKIPFDVNDILSASLMSTVVIIFFRLILYCYHEFSSFIIEADDEIICKSDDSYKKVIFLIPFLFIVNGIMIFILMMTTTTTILEIDTIIFTVVISAILAFVINIVPLGNINLGFSYRWKIELSFILLLLFFIYFNILNTNLNINIDILFKNNSQIEYNLLGPMPEDFSVTVVNSNNKVLEKKQIEESDLTKAFFEYTQTTNYDQIPNNNAKVEKTINIDDSYYKYHFVDSINYDLLEKNEKYIYVIQLQYKDYFVKKNFRVLNEFFYDGSPHFTQESFTFSE